MFEMLLPKDIVNNYIIDQAFIGAVNKRGEFESNPKKGDFVIAFTVSDNRTEGKFFLFEITGVLEDYFKIKKVSANEIPEDALAGLFMTLPAFLKITEEAKGVNDARKIT